MKTVTKAADIVGLTVRMIQEYEKYGVAIKPTERNKYGYLMYDDDAIDRLWQIRFYRELGYDKKAIKAVFDDPCNGVQREHNKKLNNGLPILHKVPPKRDYGRYFCIMAEKGGTSHGGLTEKLSLFFHAKKQEVNAYGR